MKRPRTKTQFFVVGLLLLLAGGYAAGAAYLNSSAFRQKLLHHVNTALDGRLTIEDHYLALHDARLELSGVRLYDGREELLALIPQIRLELSLLSLFGRTLHIETLEVLEARFNLGYDLSDQLRTVNAATPSSVPTQATKRKNEWSWRIDDFRLNQGSLHFRRPAKGWMGQMGSINMTARIDSASTDGQVRIKTGPVQWQQVNTAYHLPPLNLAASIDPSKTITFSLETPESSMKASGRLRPEPTSPEVDAECEFDLNPAEFKAWLPDNTEFNDRIKLIITTQGRLDDPTVTVKARLSKAKVMGVPVGQLEASLGMQERVIDIKKLKGRSDWGDIDLTGSVDLSAAFDRIVNADAAQWDRLTYQFVFNGKDLRPKRLGLLPFPLGGTFQLQSDFAGSGLVGDAAQGKAHVALQVSNLSAPNGAQDINGHLSADLLRNGAVISVDQLQAVMADNNLQGKARIDISSRRIEQAEAKMQSNHLEALGALFGVSFPKGTGTLNIRCHGPIQRPTAHIDLLASKMSMGKWPIGRLLAEARLDEQGVFNVSRMVLENQGSWVEGRGRMPLFDTNGKILADPSLQLEVAFQNLAPADFGLSSSKGSLFKGRINLGGSLQHLTGQAQLEESTIQWGEFHGQVQAKASWDDGRLTVPNLRLFKAASALNLKGTATWRQTGTAKWSAVPQIDAQVQGRDIRVQDFIPDNSGILSLDAALSGPASDLNGTFEISGLDLVFGGQPFKSLSIKGSGSKEKIYWDTLEIAVDQGQQLTSRGWFAFDRHFSLTMAANGIGLHQVVALQRAYPVDGLLDLDLTANGTVDDPLVEADVIIRDPHLNDQPWDDFQMTARVKGGRLKVAADLNFNLTADYRIDSGEFDIQAEFDHSDLSPYMALWAGADWAGELSGKLHAKGNRQDPENIQGNLSLKDTRLIFQNKPIITAPKLNARLADGQLYLPPARMKLLNDGFVNLRASGRLSDHIQITSDGRLPLAAVTPFVPTLEAPRGELTFQADAKGPLKGMQWLVKIDFLDTGFEIPGIEQQIESLKGHLEITPGLLRVEDLSGRLDGGRFTLNGRLPLEAWQPVGGQLRLGAHALPLQWPETMDVVVNGELTFKGAKEIPTLSGQLILLEGSYYKDVKLNLLSAVTQKKRAVPAASGYTVPGRLGRTALNVAVTHRYPLLVDNNLANLQVAPDLKLSGTLARPILSGRAQVNEGEVIFRRKSFAVKRGVVDFINPYKIEPNLDIVAEADIRQWQVSLSLSGTPDQLVFKLSSNPPESENDILSLILLGRTGSELAKGEGGGSQTTRQMLASLVATAWGEDVKKHSGVDILEVETGKGEDLDSADRVQLTVGKKLSRRLTLKYEVESGKEELVQRAVSEYRFLEHLLASGFQDSKGGYGGELVFRIEF